MKKRLEDQIKDLVNAFAAEVTEKISQAKMSDLARNQSAIVRPVADRFAKRLIPLVQGVAKDEILEQLDRFLGGNFRSLVAVAPAKAVQNPSLQSKKKRRWPTCCEPDCKKAYYPASGKAHFCYDHFVASGGKHPSVGRGKKSSSKKAVKEGVQKATNAPTTVH